MTNRIRMLQQMSGGTNRGGPVGVWDEMMTGGPEPDDPHATHGMTAEYEVTT